MRKWLCFAVFAFCILLGCTGRREVRRQLSEAERLMAEHPDSALSVILSMDTTKMSLHERARQELLYAYVQVLNGSWVGMDSAGVAVGDHEFVGKCDADEIRWLLVKASAAAPTGNYVARIEYLKDAEFLAIRLDDRFNLGVVYLFLSKVYEQGYNGVVSKHYADKAAEIFRSSGDRMQLRHARMAVAGAYCAKGDYRSMRDSLLAMQGEVMDNASESYKCFFLDQLARSYDFNGETAKAISIWHSLYDNKEVTSNTLAHWAYAYCQVNELDSAYSLIGRALSLPHGVADEVLCRNVECMILDKMGRRSEKAVADSLKNKALEMDAEERNLQEVSLALNKKYDVTARKAWVEASEARHRTNLAIWMAVVAVLVVAGLYLLLRKRYQLLMLQHENDVLRCAALESHLFETDSRNKEISSKIASLFHTRFKLLDGLAASFFECKETGQEQKRIYAEVMNSIKEFGSDGATRNLEDVVNGYNDNLMVRFRDDFPALSQAQYRLALYLFCGFSLPSISIFTGKDLRNIYVYKSRLKGVISKSDCERKEEYLSYFR